MHVHFYVALFQHLLKSTGTNITCINDTKDNTRMLQIQTIPFNYNNCNFKQHNSSTETAARKFAHLIENCNITV
jgi:hypothetical protein